MSEKLPIAEDVNEEHEEQVNIEGDTGIEVEDTHSEDAITDPFDPTQIRLVQSSMTIDLICSRIKQDELNLHPDFQRKAGIWSDGAQSRLIESILIRIPLPAFYFDGTDDDRWLVVDGLQRLTAIKRFVIDKTLLLSELEFIKEHTGHTFDQLPRGFQRRILETQVIVFKIEKGTPDKVKFHVFKRINTGGLPLSAQEIRHALNQGKATRLLNELAESQVFKQATVYGIRDTRMADRECVLRFLAFTIVPYTDYKVADLDGFLNDIMARINRMQEKEIANLHNQFNRTMKAARAIFNRNAFRKYYGEGYSRFPINKALLETWSVNLNRLSEGQLSVLIERKDTLMSEFAKLMREEEFVISVSQGTGDLKRVKMRFSRIERLINEVLT